MDSLADRGGKGGRDGFFRGLSEDLCDAVELFFQDRADEIELDEIDGQLWDWFWSLSHGRQAGMAGWLALSATEMDAWSRLTGNVLRPEEWQVLRDMDAAFLRESTKKPEDRGERPELTPAIFDAMFG